MLVESGVHAVVERMVGPDDTAATLGSGDVEVLATPRLIAWCEQAACAAVARQLADGETTVGLRVEFTHLAPTRVGSIVRAEATLDRIDGRRMLFTVTANDACGLVGAGKMQRVVVERDQFMQKAR